MIQMDIEVSYIDHRPTDKSIPHRLIKWLLGEEVARRLSYTVTVPKDET